LKWLTPKACQESEFLFIDLKLFEDKRTFGDLENLSHYNRSHETVPGYFFAGVVALAVQLGSSC
jgi:hypothetical protein